jgi:hypothetical protein
VHMDGYFVHKPPIAGLQAEQAFVGIAGIRIRIDPGTRRFRCAGRNHAQAQTAGAYEPFSAGEAVGVHRGDLLVPM